MSIGPTDMQISQPPSKELTITPRDDMVRDEDVDYVVFCFADLPGPASIARPSTRVRVGARSMNATAYLAGALFRFHPRFKGADL